MVKVIPLIISVIILICYWYFKKNTANNVKKRNENSISNEISEEISRLKGIVKLIFISWFLLYLIIGLSPLWKEQNNIVLFFQNIIQNITTIFLAAFYFTMTKGKSTTVIAKNFEQLPLNGWIFVLLVLTVLEILVTTKSEFLTGLEIYPIYFRVLYGMGQALAMFLIAGKLDDYFISKYLSTITQNENTIYRKGIVLLYCYAAIQPLYPYLNDSFYNITDIGNWIGILALGFKIIYLFILISLFKPREFEGYSIISLMENFLYETGRFSYESMSSYSRSFIRDYLTPFFLLIKADDQKGILGVEYSYFNDYKQQNLLPEKMLKHGVWIKRVANDSNAMKAGIRAGDIILSINNVDIGKKSSFGKALEGFKPKDKATIEFLRDNSKFDLLKNSDNQIRKKEVLVELHNIKELYHNIDIEDTLKARLNIGFIAHSSSGGVIIQDDKNEIKHVTTLFSTFWKKKYDLIDYYYFQSIMEQMTPNDTLILGDTNNAEFPYQHKWNIDNTKNLKIKINKINHAKTPIKSIIKKYPNLFVKEIRQDQYFKNTINYYLTCLFENKQISDAIPADYLCVFDMNQNFIFDTVIPTENPKYAQRTIIQLTNAICSLFKEENHKNLTLVFSNKPKLYGDDFKSMLFDSALFLNVSFSIIKKTNTERAMIEHKSKRKTKDKYRKHKRRKITRKMTNKRSS